MHFVQDCMQGNASLNVVNLNIKFCWSTRCSCKHIVATARLVTYHSSRSTSSVGGCTVGSTAYYVGYVWWISSSFFLRCKTIYRLSSLMLLDNTKKRSVLQPFWSPDVTSCDLYLWSHLRNVVYSIESTCGTSFVIDWSCCDNIQRILFVTVLS